MYKKKAWLVVNDWWLDLSSCHSDHNTCYLLSVSLWSLAWLKTEAILNLPVPGIKPKGVVQLTLEELLRK